MTMKQKMMNGLTNGYVMALLFMIPTIGMGTGYILADKPINEGKKLEGYGEYRQYRDYQFGVSTYGTHIQRVVTEELSSGKPIVGYKVIIPTKSGEPTVRVKNAINLGTEVVNRPEVTKVLNQLTNSVEDAKKGNSTIKTGLENWAILSVLDNKVALKEVVNSKKLEIRVNVTKKDEVYKVQALLKYVPENESEDIKAVKEVIKKTEIDKLSVAEKNEYKIEKAYTEEELKKNGLAYLL